MIDSTSRNLRGELRTSCSAVQPPLLAGSPPFILQYPLQPAGNYVFVIEMRNSRTGAIEINVPVASYDIHAERDGRSVEIRAATSSAGVRVESWQVK
jgi:hypothetical protein